MGGQRRRSTSGGSLSESPVAPYLWQISPTQQSPPISSSTQMLQQGKYFLSDFYYVPAKKITTILWQLCYFLYQQANCPGI